MKDLLGRTVKDRQPFLSGTLRKYDRDTFHRRLSRLQFIHRNIPKGYGFMLPPESAFIVREVKWAFINGHDVATLMLSQAFIEHVLQIAITNYGHPRVAQRRLSDIVKWLKINHPEHEFIMGRVDKLRRFRNPFSHLRPFDDPDTISQRSLQDRVPLEYVLEKEAKEAICLMYQVAFTKFG